MPKPITSLTGFVKKIVDLKSKNGTNQLLYRGHSKQDYVFEPSIYRQANHSKSEHLMIRQMISEHPDAFSDDPTLFDKLVRMQHYGLPTRLLDVSYNPLVGLYFACCSNPKSRGQVIIVKPDIKRLKYFDGDTVALLSSLSLLTAGEKKNLTKSAKLHQHKSTSDRVVDFNKEKGAVQKLLHYIQDERPNFRPQIDLADLARVIAVVPKKLHPRIRAQDGAFLVFGLEEASESFATQDIAREVIDIHEDHKSKIIDDLALMGISEHTLFPEIDKSAEQIKRRYS